MPDSTIFADRGDTERPPAARIAFPIVGIGASAGGIAPLQTFFDGMPGDSGMAFVVVMHLSPTHESILATTLQFRAHMPVTQVVETVEAEPNHVYVIPPNKHLVMDGPTLRLVDSQQAPGLRVAIDLFFRTLSASCGPRAICIVMSGADSDGAIGIKHIKEQGGIVIVQDPTEAEFDSMPRAVIATGMADWTLPAAQIPLRLLEFMQNEQRMHIPPEEGHDGEQPASEDRSSGGPATVAHVPVLADETALHEILRFLHGQTSHDFSHYKRATILRRVARRMQVNLLEDLPSYLIFLRSHSSEATALLHDLLISVTNFFRDRDAFAALEAHVPQLFAGKGEGEQVRVWVAGCATGEEAYSVAMLLHEHAARLASPPVIQVFGTDIDEDVIQSARAGLYPPTIEADVSQERLRRFFQKEQGRYRVRKSLRESVLFSAHSLLKDSPFSRVDLITCRNLLIYLKREAQERAFDIFHYALRPGGILFLGSSESMEEGHTLFGKIDKRHRLYVRRAVTRTGWKIPPIPFPSPSLRHAPPTLALAPLLPSVASNEAVAAPLASPPERRVLHFGELHLLMLEQYAAPSLIVSEKYDIVHLSQRAGRFLTFAGGEPSANLVKVVHPALRVELRAALFRATRGGLAVTAANVPIEMDGAPRRVSIHVRPVHEPGALEGFLLVLFEMTDEADQETRTLPPADSTSRHLEDEIQHLKQQLSVTVEQYETSTEDLRASNEELQAINEELRSATEELETSKEELQSMNEELTTINQELKSNLEELSRANSDLQNLIASTEIGTIFLDRALYIKRFTPRIQDLFNILPGDVGRPLSDITNKLDYPTLTADAESVMQSLRATERELTCADGWYMARILPYRTLDDRIDGVVLTFVDITQRKKAEDMRVVLEREVAALEERNRLAHELHDTLVQGFTGIKLQLEAAEYALQKKRGAVAGHVIRAREIAMESMAEARLSIHALRLPLIPAPSLAASLEQLAVQSSNGVAVRFQTEGAVVPLASRMEGEIYRVAQEALTNALRHGRARNIAITLAYEAGRVQLHIDDDGQGFDTNAPTDGMGLDSMRMRAARIAGEMTVVSRPGHGTRIALSVTPPQS